MSALSIHVIDLNASTTNRPIGEWIDLEGQSSDEIRETIGRMGLTAHLVDECRGFANYCPKYIEEACVLYKEYQYFCNNNLWSLFIEWYKNADINLPKTSKIFNEVFLGFYGSVEAYARERAIQYGEIDEGSEIFGYVNWANYAHNLVLGEEFLAIKDPNHTEIGIFLPFPFFLDSYSPP